MADLAKTDITGMESAGRVVPLYKGDYSSTASYQILDVVLYNNSSYIAKQTTTGNTPPTTQNFNDYWQLIAKGIIDADISDATVEFMQAETRTNIESGEDGKTLFGKIKKWFADLKSVAFSGSYNDLSDRPAIPSAVAVKGNAESSYRTGNVNLTPENIGAIATSKVLTTAEQINANTDTSNVAGATAVKAMVSQMNSNLIKSDTWLPGNGYNPFTDSSKISVYSVNPGLKPAQGLPSDVNNYGTVLSFNNVTYPVMIYQSVLGELAIWSTNSNVWRATFPAINRITLALVDENLAGYGQSSPMMECMVYGHLCLINFKFGIKGGIGSWEVKKIATGTPTPLGANVSYCCNPVISGGQGGEVMVTADYEGNLIVQGREQALSNNNWLEGTLIYFVP